MHTLQARRCLFAVYKEFWEQITQGFRRFRLRAQTVREILCNVALMPLRFSNLRAQVFGQVAASDASSYGGGFVASVGLTPEGAAEARSFFAV